MPTVQRFLVAVLFIILYDHTQAQQKANANGWTQATPLSQSLHADSLQAFINDITNGKYGHIDDVIITRNGKLVLEKHFQNDYKAIYGKQAAQKSALNPLDPGGPYNYFNDWWHPYYHNTDLHTLQSVTKTMTSLIIGVAVTRKEFPDLSTPVLAFFDTTSVKNIDDRKRRLNIRHLLTMTAGFDWDEGLPYSDPRNDCIRMEASCDWIEYVINKPMAIEPGVTFRYNSGASQLLSHIFRKATGKDIEQYAFQYLFSPLGIRDFYWKRTPGGLVDSEGGLYLSAKDLAKIFYMVSQEGSYNGQTIIAPDWIRSSVKGSVTLRGGVQYGYKWWLYGYGNKGNSAWAGSGFGGQWPMIIPEYNIVAVFTGWNIGEGRSLRATEAINRLIEAVADKK